MNLKDKSKQLVIAGLPIARCTALDPKQLIELYDATDWSFIRDYRIRSTYNDTPTANLLKICALPFLVEIPTERALIRELEERPRLQTLCGFALGDRLPSRGTLWNFRNHLRRINLLHDLMLRLLLEMTFAGSKLGIPLPYITECSHTPSDQSYRVDRVKLNSFVRTRLLYEIETAFEDNGEFGVLSRKTERPKKEGITKGLSIPKYVELKIGEEQSDTYRMRLPDWLRTQFPQRDTIRTLGSSRREPYTACSIIVIKRSGSRRYTLLGIRRTGFGKGLLSLPGGKQQNDETLRECARRELFEETGLKEIASHPVSIHKTTYPGKPWVLSVGVVVTEYSGKLRNRERHQSTDWQWYDLASLPANLFGPTRIAIGHYLDKRFPNLTWEDIEQARSRIAPNSVQTNMFLINENETSTCHEGMNDGPATPNPEE